MLLRRSLVAQADDLQSIFGLIAALEQLGTREADEEADQLYRRFIEEHPNSPRAEQAENARIAFAHRQLKSNSVGGFEPEMMMYIAGALAPINKHGAQERQAIALEIAILGCSGLDIDDPDEKYSPKSLQASSRVCTCWPACTRRSGRSTRRRTQAWTSQPSTRRR